MNKIRCIISCPLDTYSGYGKRSLDLVKEIIRVYPEWDVEILSQRWGDCRMGYLKDHEEYEIMGHLISGSDLQPDIWIQITVPNEFQRLGRFNIGITAAMETTLSDVSWIEGVNRMDLVLTSSEHGKRSLTESKWKESGNLIETEKPVKVLFEGVDTSKYYKIVSKKGGFKSNILKDLDSSWNFLCIGHWMKGDFGQDRKNIGYTIKVFLETFKDRDNAPGLILKTSQANTSVLDREEILRRIYDIQDSVKYTKSLPNIYLLHGELSDSEINEIYNDSRIRAMVSFTKGEGFGRPLIEFAAIGKPIIVSGWSGQMDFLNTLNSMVVGGTIEKVHPSAVQPGMILQEAAWFRPDDTQAVNALNEVYTNWSSWNINSNAWSREINTDWTLEKMGDRFKSIIDPILPEFPEKVSLVLPGLDQ